MIERTKFGYAVHEGIFIQAYSSLELISKIKARGHPIDDQLIEIIKNMKEGDTTMKPEAFYGNIPSVNGVPKK